MIKIVELLSHVQEIVTIRGHVSKVQSFPKHLFVDIRDGPGSNNKVQVFVSKNKMDTDTIILEQYVEISGTVAKLPDGKWSYQPVEIHMDKYVILGQSNSDYSTRSATFIIFF